MTLFLKSLTGPYLVPDGYWCSCIELSRSNSFVRGRVYVVSSLDHGIAWPYRSQQRVQLQWEELDETMYDSHTKAAVPLDPLVPGRPMRKLSGLISRYMRFFSCIVWTLEIYKKVRILDFVIKILDVPFAEQPYTLFLSKTCDRTYRTSLQDLGQGGLSPGYYEVLLGQSGKFEVFQLNEESRSIGLDVRTEDTRVRTAAS